MSADAVEVRNDLQGGPYPKAIENEKMEYVLQKSLSEILVPVNPSKETFGLGDKLEESTVCQHSMLSEI